MWAVQVALACNNRDCKINQKIYFFSPYFLCWQKPCCFSGDFPALRLTQFITLSAQYWSRSRKRFWKQLLKRQLQNARKGVVMPYRRDKVGGRKWSRQERAEPFSNALLHLLEFKSDFSQWFVLLFTWTSGAPQLFDIYFVACVCVQPCKKTTQKLAWN